MYRCMLFETMSNQFSLTNWVLDTSQDKLNKIPDHSLGQCTKGPKYLCEGKILVSDF